MSTTTGPDLHERAVKLLDRQLGYAEASIAEIGAVEYRYTLAILRAVGPVREALAKLQELVDEVQDAHSDPDDPGYSQCDEAPCAWCSEADELLHTALALFDAATGGEG